MAYFMFVDESGQDRQESPYEVLAGLVIEDKRLWPLVQALHRAELDHFGCKYGTAKRELKATKLLKTKVFRHASLCADFNSKDRKQLSVECLTKGAGITPDHYAALGQAKIAYAEQALKVAKRFDCRAFASIVPKSSPRPTGDHLRKDYSFLFERFYFFLEPKAASTRGLIVFDELDRSQSHLLIDQMERYFVNTYTGRIRSGRVIPEPFFVHSHLTTGVHLADLVAYVISWGVRERGMTAPHRPELTSIARAASALRLNQRRASRTVWAFNVISDLRPRKERGVPVRGLASRPGRTN